MGEDRFALYASFRLFQIFCVGHSEYAFNGIRYPEGILPRGSIWSFGLYICPKTHRFFCWFHNETGWNGKGTAYDAFGLCKTPKFDSDFRHVRLIHSDDEGLNWTFDRWVLAGNEAAFTDLYNPGAGNAVGQDSSKPVRNSIEKMRQEAAQMGVSLAGQENLTNTAVGTMTLFRNAQTADLMRINQNAGKAIEQILRYAGLWLGMSTDDVAKNITFKPSNEFAEIKASAQECVTLIQSDVPMTKEEKRKYLEKNSLRKLI